jgi:hypothetical protein
MTRATGRMLTMVERTQLMHCQLVRRLACGCEVALYTTATGRLLTVVEDAEDSCPNRGHQADFVIGDQVARPTFAKASTGEAA